MLHEYTYTEHVMGSELVFSIVSESELTATSAFAEALAICNHYENIFSRFRESSELSVLNARKHAMVSTTFLDVLRESIHLSGISGGAYNPLVQIAQHGYTVTFKNLRQPTYTDTAAYSTDLTKIVIDKSASSVKIEEDHMLDFGGFLKGYLASLIADRFISFAGVIVNLGGDIATRGRDRDGGVFEFEITSSEKCSPHYSLPLENTSLATSGTHKRSWRTHTDVKHHILSPITHDNPTTSVASASIIHADGGLTDALATASFSLPTDELRLIAQHQDAQYILIDQDSIIKTNIPTFLS